MANVLTCLSVSVEGKLTDFKAVCLNVLPAIVKRPSSKLTVASAGLPLWRQCFPQPLKSMATWLSAFTKRTRSNISKATAHSNFCEFFTSLRLRSRYNWFAYVPQRNFIYWLSGTLGALARTRASMSAKSLKPASCSIEIIRFITIIQKYIHLFECGYPPTRIWM